MPDDLSPPGGPIHDHRDVEANTDLPVAEWTYFRDRLTQAWRVLDLPPVPADVAQRLRRLVSEPAGPVRYRAIVVNDSRAASELVGVRGGEDDWAGGWTLTLAADVGELIVDVRPDLDEDTFDVDVQVLVDEPVSSPFAARLTGPSDRLLVTSEFGCAEFVSLPPGRFELTVTNGSTAIVAELFLADRGGHRGPR
jgi:hypothetical protein